MIIIETVKIPIVALSISSIAFLLSFIYNQGVTRWGYLPPTSSMSLTISSIIALMSSKLTVANANFMSWSSFLFFFTLFPPFCILYSHYSIFYGYCQYLFVFFIHIFIDFFYSPIYTGYIRRIK